MPTGFFVEDMKKEMNAKLKQKFGADNIIAAAMNYQVYFDRKVLADSKLELDDVRDYVMTELKKSHQFFMFLARMKSGNHLFRNR